MESKLESARREITEQIKSLKIYQREHFRSPLITLMETAKVAEIVKIFEPAPADERRSMRELLSTIFPTQSDTWSRLKN